jgi:hypothetical protein
VMPRGRVDLCEMRVVGTERRTGCAHLTPAIVVSSGACRPSP